jgi:hypothetical protein
MRAIKSYDEFVNEEAISGTEVPVPLNGKGSYFGAAYGDTESPNTIDSGDTTVRYSKIDGRFYSILDYQEIYDEFVEKGGDINTLTNDKTKNGMSEENISIILSKINR